VSLKVVKIGQVNGTDSLGLESLDENSVQERDNGFDRLESGGLRMECESRYVVS
jgi:hypothetical protein